MSEKYATVLELSEVLSLLDAKSGVSRVEAVAGRPRRI
jgi:hypothetical protein